MGVARSRARFDYVMIPTSVYKVMDETARLACDYAFTYATESFKTLKGGRACFFPVVEETEDGIEIGVGINPQYHYLIYQENGFKSFTMKWALGRVIPIHVNGQIVYRKCTNLNQFRSGFKNYWQRDANGELYSRWQQRRSWVHPGHVPVKFIDDAIDRAVDENADKIAKAALKYERGDGKWQTFWSTLTEWFLNLIGR